MRVARHQTEVNAMGAGDSKGRDVTPDLRETPVPARRGLAVRHLVPRVTAFRPKPDVPGVLHGVPQGVRVGGPAEAV